MAVEIRVAEEADAIPTATERATLRRVIVAASIGTLFEWYDFYLYGSLAIFFGQLFFPSGNETAQLLASLATFGAGFGVRPLGANAEGLNLLAVEAPPRLLPLAAPAILAGQEGGWLERAGYHHRHDVSAFRLRLDGGFVLDGEAYPAEVVTIRTGTPIRFVTA